MILRLFLTIASEFLLAREMQADGVSRRLHHCKSDNVVH